jgi:uncharacterized SAM-binding protein YcdF (DUF218 family)
MSTRAHATRFAIVALLIILILGCAIFAFRHAGRWLVHEDPLSHGDAILVLSGSMPYRAEEAAKVYNAGYASEVWLTHPVSAAEELESMGIRFIADEDYDRAVLIHDGVPAAAIRVLPGEIIDTQQEIEEAKGEMSEEGKSTIIIVTSLEHTRRVGVLWSRLVGPNPKAIIHGAPEDPYDAAHWWRNTGDALKVVREYLGLLNAWTGLRIRPAGSLILNYIRL